MVSPRKASILATLVAAALALSARGLAATNDETIEIRGCADSNAHVVDDPSAEQGFVCECDEGFVDLDDGGDADCTLAWDGFLDVVFVPICLLVPDVCNPTPPTPEPPTEDEDDPCEACAVDYLDCLTDVDADTESIEACTEALEPALLQCVADANAACTGAADYRACLQAGSASCAKRYTDALVRCHEEVQDIVSESEFGFCLDDLRECQQDAQCAVPDAEPPPGATGFSAPVFDLVESVVEGIPGVLVQDLEAPTFQLVTGVAGLLGLPAPSTLAPLEGPAPTPLSCAHCGAVVSFRGARKLGLRGTGRSRERVALGVRLADGLFEMRDTAGHLFLGTWTPKGRRGRRLELALDPATPAAPLLADALAALGVPLDALTSVEPARFRAKLRRDGTLAATLKIRFTALVDGAPRAGRYRARLEGIDITGP